MEFASGAKVHGVTEAKIHPGVAQLVGRLIWELEQVGSHKNEPLRKPIAALALFLHSDFSSPVKTSV